MHSIGGIIAENRKKKKLSQQDLVDLLLQKGIDVTTKAISKWETDAREPSIPVFFTICRILEVADPYQAFFGENPYNVMNGLNEEGQNKVLDYIEILKETGRFKPKKCQIIAFPQREMDIYRAVSAGTGQYLSDAVKETYDVKDLAPENADFGVRISGDSMEPQFHDGEIAWVKQTECLASGEIGIFFLNGDGFIKQFHDDADGTALVSLNTKYPPIQIHETDSFKTFGRVVGSTDSSKIEGYFR